MFSFNTPSSSDYAVEFLRHTVPASLKAGQTGKVSLTFRNVSGRTWPAKGAKMVRLGYRWYRADGASVLSALWQAHYTGLFFNLRAGKDITLNAMLSAPKAPGNYILRWDLLEGQSTWFSTQGGATLDVSVQVPQENATPISQPATTPSTGGQGRVNASHNAVFSGPDSLQGVLDALIFTRWSTRQPQEPGMWFAIDLEKSRFITGLVLAIPGSPDHFPRGFIVRVSQDQQTWKEVARNPINLNALDVDFSPTLARFIHIEQTGRAESWWSIHQIQVKYAGASSSQPSGASAARSLRLSEKGTDFIAHHEGLRLKLYNDVAGHCTIGVGHLVHIGPCDGRAEETPYRQGITEAQAKALLKQDVQTAEGAVQRQVGVRLSQTQFDALVSFVFNVGAGNFASSDLLTRLNQGDYESVPAELNRWNKAGGQVVRGLVRRRQAEGDLFSRGVY